MKIGKLALILILTGTVAAMLVTMNFLLFRTLPTIFSILNIFSLFIFAFPVVMMKYQDYRVIKEREELFPVFLRDFVETIRGGMTLPQAFATVSKNDYKGLNPFIKKMTAQMEWGIPVDKVLSKFGKESKSKLISRIVSSVMESHKFGGNLADTFEALSKTSLEVDRLRQERKLYMNSQMMTGYIVFFVFLSVMVGLQKSLVPSLTATTSGGLSGVEAPPADIGQQYKDVFRNLILIQGFFAGLSVGKMAEGSMISGIKHSLFMMFAGSLVYLVAVG